MASGGAVEPRVNLDKVQSDIGELAMTFCITLTVDKLWELVNSQPSITPAQKAAIKSMYGEVVKSLGHTAEDNSSAVELESAAVTRIRGPKQRRSSSQFLRPNVEDRTEVEEAHLPFLHLKRKTGTDWGYSQKLTNICESPSYIPC
jgi:fatty acid synthase subunit alpha